VLAIRAKGEKERRDIERVEGGNIVLEGNAKGQDVRQLG